MVGGDFYDVWPVDGSWLVLIGDVTGKGIEAAALTALVRHTVRTASEFESSPASLLALVDSTLKKRPALSLCTALILRLKNDEITLAMGGHPWPLRITTDRVEEVGEPGPLLGGFSDVYWQNLTLALEPGSALMLYTDGITDARDVNGERFGLTRLRETLEPLRGRPAEEVLQRVTRTLDEFQTAGHADDIAAIALRRIP